jgi:tRNA (mo5U34)-methyltransferase
MNKLTNAEVRSVSEVKWFHSIALGEYQGEAFTTPGITKHPEGATERFGLPEDLSGKTVLDIGAWDGGFSFEAEARGAELVVAADIPDSSNAELLQIGNWGANKGFRLAHKLLQSKVVFLESSVNDIIPNLARAGLPLTFDYVLFYGVLYHVVDPFRALMNLYIATGAECLIETAYSSARGNFMELRNGHDGDYTNWWYPTEECLSVMLQSVGFSHVSRVGGLGDSRITVKASRGDVPEVNRIMAEKFLK